MAVHTVAFAAAEVTLGHAQLPGSGPVHTVKLPAYALATMAVSNAEYALFIAAGGYDDPQWWLQAGWRWRNTRAVNAPGFWAGRAFNAPAQPVVGVCWYEAVAFATWFARHTNTPWRLPTEAEWEAAARADGDDIPANVNTAERGLGRTIGVGEGVATPRGLWNLHGNVFEWCSTRWGHNWQSHDYPYPYDPNDGREDLGGTHARHMRGGSWFGPRAEAHPAARSRYLPGSRGSNIGFRLAYSQ